MARTFAHEPAKRGKVPLLVGLVGPSGGGKTFSALRLASGIQRVSGGQIFMIDTESRRSLHYADKFKFQFVEFKAPFGPLEYLEALEYCKKNSAGIVIIDSMSHEHEGPGGVLEMHEAEVQRLSGGDWRKAERIKMLAWSKPKRERRRLLNSVLQMGMSVIFCFRARKKIKLPKRGDAERDPIEQGWMPIAGDEFVFEMTINCLLLPHAEGHPSWRTEYPGESEMMKLPDQFQSLFAKDVQLDEALGERMARWAEGEEGTPSPAPRPAVHSAQKLCPVPTLPPEPPPSDEPPPEDFPTLTKHQATAIEHWGRWGIALRPLEFFVGGPGNPPIAAHDWSEAQCEMLRATWLDCKGSNRVDQPKGAEAVRKRVFEKFDEVLKRAAEEQAREEMAGDPNTDPNPQP